MGLFGKSLSRELGKNTGKWVSNKVFGKTGHATPHHIVHSREGDISNNKNKGLISSAFSETKRTDAEIKAEIDEDKREEQEEREERANKRNKMEELATFVFSTDQDDISNSLNYLISIASSNNDPWDDEEKKIKQLCIEKIEFGIMKLENAGGNAESDFFKQKLKKLNKKKMFGF